MNQDIYRKIADCGVIAVLEITDANNAVPAAKALVRGGVGAIELALRTDAAYESIRRIKAEVPEMLMGIGTVIKPGQAGDVKAMGADFALAPGFNRRIAEESMEADLPFIPGISTASEIEAALELDLRVLKLFPAEPLGGVRYLNSMAGPYSYLGLRFIPLGGLTLDNLPLWAAESRILAVGGTWIAKKALIESHDWEAIEKNAAAAAECWRSVRK